MIIGIVSDSNERYRFYEALLSLHTLLHFTPGEILSGISASCDGFLLDVDLLNGDDKKLQELLSQMRGREVSAFEEIHPCILRNNSVDGLKLQCGRVAAVRARENAATERRGSGHVHTLIFQDDSDDCVSVADSPPD